MRGLRRLGNTDPVIAFHVDNEVTDADVKVMADPLAAPLFVVDVADIADESDRWASRYDLHLFRSYYCLNLALLHSPFEATMLMNTDTLFFMDPVHWWYHEKTIEFGSMFFYDRHFGARPVNACGEIERFAHLMSSMDGRPYTLSTDFRARHRSFCDSRTAYELECSLTLLNRTHPAGRGTLRMLRRLLPFILDAKRTMGISLNIPLWGHGDKEFYWIACELAGFSCAFNPAGRPFEVALGGAGRMGCQAHMYPSPSAARPNVISHVNLDQECYWETAPLQVLNSAARSPVRLLNAAERATLSAFNDAARSNKTSLLARYGPSVSDPGDRLRLAWCRKQAHLPDAAAYVRNNSFFDPADSNICNRDGTTRNILAMQEEGAKGEADRQKLRAQHEFKRAQSMSGLARMRRPPPPPPPHRILHSMDTDQRNNGKSPILERPKPHRFKNGALDLPITKPQGLSEGSLVVAPQHQNPRASFKPVTRAGATRPR